MTRDLVLYGDLPDAYYVLRVPLKGTPWRTQMQAARRLVKLLTNTPRHEAAPDWWIEGDAPDWETCKGRRFEYSTATGEFSEITR